MKTYIHKFKCLSCSLHYAIHSEHESWPNGEDHRSYCPECGSMGPKLHGMEESSKFIFQPISFTPETVIAAGETK